MAQEFRVYSPASFGTAIRHYRRQAGLTQEELARRTNVGRWYLSELEQGKNTEQLARMVDIFKELGVRITLSRES